MTLEQRPYPITLRSVALLKLHRSDSSSEKPSSVGAYRAVSPLEFHLKTLRVLLAHGGPQKKRFHEVTEWISELMQDVRSGRVSVEGLKEIRRSFGEAFSSETMQGMAFQKPHGYPGDYEIIERIYDRCVSLDPRLQRWDEYWHAHPAATAVRNRLEFFGHVMSETTQRQPEATVLNIASGPGTDLHRFLLGHSSFQGRVTCVDADVDAVHYASEKLADQRCVEVIHANALKFTPPTGTTYDLIWSAGLFDYFDDETFLRLLSRIVPWLAPDGRIVIGNFSTTNPSRDYMALFDWNLEHRSTTKLLTLGRQVTAQRGERWAVEVRREPEGVNLFLQLTRCR